MTGGCIALDRILGKLDQYLHRNDYTGAQRHLEYWLQEALAAGDSSTELTVRNELMGLYRKLGREKPAVEMAQSALARVEAWGISHQVGAATTCLNAATVYKAFGRAQEALALYERAAEIYAQELDPADTRIAGLCNNMALALVDLGLFDRAEALYTKALAVLAQTENNEPEMAITHLNLASLAEAKLDLEDGWADIEGNLGKARALLEGYGKWDGNYAFVCEKCASVYGYYGFTDYANTLAERSRRIYEGT